MTGHDLNADGAIETTIFGSVDLSHASDAQQAENLVGAELLSTTIRTTAPRCAAAATSKAGASMKLSAWSIGPPCIRCARTSSIWVTVIMLVSFIGWHCLMK
jgi:hypothetical protein